MSRDQPSDGFTLLEVIVALTVSAVVVLLAQGIAGALGDTTERVVSSSVQVQWRMNMHLTLRELAQRLFVSSGGHEFEGDTLRTEFTSSCLTPRGWMERCRITIRADSAGTGKRISVHASTGWIIRDSVTFAHGGLRYLVSGRGGGTWVNVWGTSIRAPHALGIIRDRDTLLIRFGRLGAGR